MTRITKRRLQEQTALVLVNDPTLTIEAATEKARDLLRRLDAVNEPFDASQPLTLKMDGAQSVQLKSEEQ